jgi:hypothetical protein
MQPGRFSDTPQTARTALRLGQASISALVLSFALGIAIESIGINSFLRTLVVPLSLITILLSLSARRALTGPADPGYREASLGLKLGLASLIFSMVFMVGVFLFFLLWLGA